MPDKPSNPRDNVSNDLAVLQQILALQVGQLDNFRPTRPPPAIRRFLARAMLTAGPPLAERRQRRTA